MKSLLGFVFGLSFCLILTALAGENPFHILQVLVKSSVGSFYDLGICLFYTTTFIFTGLSVCIAFRSGLFNIGAEGQMTMGVLGGTIFALTFSDLPSPFLLLGCTGAAILASGLWGFIPGYLKAFRGSHEVIVTMMMNFLAAGISSYFILHYFKNPGSQNPESASIPTEIMFSSLIADSPFNYSFFIALIAAFLTHLLLGHTIFGYNLRMAGLNENTANLSGISSKQIKLLTMLLAGAFAGLVFLNEVLGSAGKFRIGFSSDYGFIGIAVALLARSQPLGIIFTAFLFGVLQKGSADLDLETQFITRDFSKVLQAVIIFSVVSFEFLNFEKIKNIYTRST